MGRTETSQHIRLHRNILQELGHALPPNAKVLDFGCGSGEMVSAYRAAGYDALGCDVKLEHPEISLRLMDKADYRIPFDDSAFDFVFSDQVMEHLSSHRIAFAEIRRVLRPGGISLHIFPARLRPTEAHTFVPLAGVIQNYPWLLLWALCGIRNSFQKGKGFREVARLNQAYLEGNTKYLSKKEIIQACGASFGNIAFAESHMIKHSYGRASFVYPIVKFAPFLSSLYSTFYTRVIFFQKEC